MPPKNLIFVIAYSSPDHVREAVAHIPEWFLKQAGSEVLIIDSGTSDRMFHVSDQMLERWNSVARLTVLNNAEGRDYGANQKLGYRYALDRGFDRLYLVHADGKTSPEALLDLKAGYEHAPGVDAVFGYPTQGSDSLFHWFGKKVVTRVQNMLLGSRLREFHSGYRSYSTEILKKIAFELNSDSCQFDTELVIQINCAGGSIREVPVAANKGERKCHTHRWRYVREVLLSCLHYRVHNLGFLYDRKFDLAQSSVEVYQGKDSSYSTHHQIVSRVKPGSRVLDVGCGHGFIAQLLIDKGCTVDGVDMIDPSLVTAPLAHYFQIDLMKNLPAFEALLAANHYDTIVLADIIEHVPAPEKLLDAVRNSCVLAGGSHIIASTGNIGFFVVRLMLLIGKFNYAPRGILDLTHVRLFTVSSFKRIFQQCGFKVLAIRGIGLPISAIANSKSRWSYVGEVIFDFLARTWRGFFAYQILIEARPLPTVRQLLQDCESHASSHRL